MNKQKRDIKETFRRYYRPLCLHAIQYLRDMDLVGDVVQNTRELKKRKNNKNFENQADKAIRKLKDGAIKIYNFFFE